MLEADENALRQPLLRRTSVLRSLSKVSFFLMILVAAFFLFAAIALLVSAGFSSSQLSRPNALLLVFFVTRSVLSVCLYGCLALFFRQLAVVGSPFTLEQAKRLRVVSALLVADALLGLISIPGATGFSPIGLFQLPAPTPTFDLRSFALAALLLVISYAFEYGERLQDDSDEIA
ncbi:MAG: hypothetical protein WAY93_04530 [Atopobiaceae bacterium]|jgi:hypothetical protein|nr:hypothetical protein [Atopobiaceae bacterium]